MNRLLLTKSRLVNEGEKREVDVLIRDGALSGLIVGQPLEFDRTQ